MYPFLILSGIIFLSLNTTSCYGATDTLSHKHALTRNERLVSENGKFALGFFNPRSKSSDSDNTIINSYLGIWFNQVSTFTPVWTANRDNPISNLVVQKLMISGDGNLVVLAHGKIVWSTNVHITANNTVAVLLGNGNFILRSSWNMTDIFWQSFDYPTDTLLSGAKLGSNKVTGLNHYYVSRKNLIDQASGVYSNKLGFDRSMRISWKNSVEYWSSGEWNGRFFNSIPEMSGDSFSNLTFVDNDQEVYFSYTLLDENTIFQVFLDVSGQWKVRIWNGHDWIAFSSYPKYRCDVYGVCGAFTICSNNENPSCNCMKGFSIRSVEDWETEDRTGGCIRNTPLNCFGLDKNGTDKVDEFYSLPFIRLPENSKGIPNATSPEACMQTCLSNCSCTAYSYDKGGCSVWHHELINVVTDAYDGQTLYLRLAAKELQSLAGNKHRLIIGVIIGVSTTTTLVLIIMLVISRCGKWSNHAIDSDQETIGIIAFKYNDVKRATKNFSEKLGGGGFGSVFKGNLSDSVDIAVKRVDGARQGEKQFRAEVSSIGIIQHINLVKLLGFCCEDSRGYTRTRNASGAKITPCYRRGLIFDMIVICCFYRKLSKS